MKRFMTLAAATVLTAGTLAGCEQQEAVRISEETQR